MNTKEKIIKAAISHFNKSGFTEASMRSIAATCGITLSNLQYHFKTKDMLLEAIFDEISDFFNGKADFSEGDPDLQILLDMNKMVFEFQHKYLFYFSELSAVLQAYPAVQKKNLAIKNKRIAEYVKLFSAYAAQDLFKPEPYPGFFQLQAELLWFLGNYYMLSQLSDGKAFSKQSFDEGNNLSIMLVHSLLSEKGVQEMTKLMKITK